MAASILNEFLRLSPGEQSTTPLEIDALASTEVARNLKSGDTNSIVTVFVGDSRPWSWTKPPRNRYTAALTVFGPHYRKRVADTEHVGFALPRLIYSLDEVGLPSASFQERALNRVRWSRFRAADSLVTETETAAEALRSRLGEMPIAVIPNCVSEAVLDRCNWCRNEKLGDLDPKNLNLAVVGRDYAHKNLDFLSALGPSLQSVANRQVRFVVTLDDLEWSSKPRSFRDYCKNIGVVPQTELGPLYSSCAATLLPSLLEVASATPRESMALGVPVFLASLPLNRTQFGPAAAYFNPWDADQAAHDIGPYLMNPAALRGLAFAGLRWASQQPSPKERAIAYLQLLERGI